MFSLLVTHTQNKRRHSVLLVLTREGSNPKTHMLLIFIHGNFNKLQIALIKMKSPISSFATHTNTHSYTRSPLITPLCSPGKLAGRLIISEVTGRMGWTWLMGDICRICLLSGQRTKEWGDSSVIKQATHMLENNAKNRSREKNAGSLKKSPNPINTSHSHYPSRQDGVNRQWHNRYARQVCVYLRASTAVIGGGGVGGGVLGDAVQQR